MSNHHKSLVVKSNALIEAMTDMALQDMRFLAFAASQLPHHPKALEEHGVGKPYDMEIDVQAFADAFGITEKNAYREVEKVASRLQKRIVELKPDQTLDGYRVKVGLITKQKYHDAEGRVWFRIDEDLLPHIMGLSRDFTPYRLKDVYQFSKTSTWRLYELLRKEKKIGKVDFDLDDLRWKLGVEDKYPRPIDLRRWVIDPSTKEINSMSDIKVQYEQRKRGRRIVGFTFHIIENQDTKTPREKVRAKLEKEFDHGEDLAPELAKTLREDYRMNPKQARQMANSYSKRKEELLKLLPKLKERWEKLPDANPKTGKKKTSLGGYIFKALQNELQGTLM